jgi:hypothetical protein
MLLSARACSMALRRYMYTGDQKQTHEVIFKTE